MLTADHGESLGEHGEATHGIFAYESTLRVPLVIYHPRLWQPAVVATSVRHIDILPTALAALSLPVPPTVSGRSLLPVIAGVSRDDSPAYFEALSASFTRGWAPLTGVVKGEAKFVELPLPELYALDDDPSETRNLAEIEGSRMRELQMLLRSMTSAAASATPVPESVEARQRLQSLGYASATPAASRAPITEADDPKRLIELDRMLQDVTGRYLSGDLRGALDECRALVKRRPTMTVALLYLAQLERDAGDIGAGIAALQQALALQPNSPEAIALLGAYLGDAGRAADAVALLEHHVHDSPADPQIVSAYAIALAKLQRFKEATAALETARQQDPSRATLLVETGTIQMMAGNRDAARTAFQSAIGFNPDLARAHTSLGILALEDGNVDQAYAHWRRAVDADRRELNTLLALASAQERAGRGAAARPIVAFLQGYRR